MIVNIKQKPVNNFDTFVQEVIETISESEHPGEVTIQINHNERSVTFSYQRWDDDEPETIYYPYNMEIAITDNIYYCVGRFFCRI